MSNSAFLTCLRVSCYHAKFRRGYYRFPDLWSKRKIVITPKPVMILAWNLNQQLNLTRETRQPQKNYWLHHVGKLYDPWYVILNIFSIALSKGTISTKTGRFFAKSSDISKIKQVLVLKDIFSETTYARVLMCQFSTFSCNPKKF